MSVTIQLRGDSAANWTATNPVLHQREAGVETDTGKLKIGDGVTAWTSLSYFGGAVSSVFGRTGAVVATSGDYTAAQVGADASGAAASAQAASLQKSANLSDVANAATARTNLGLLSTAAQRVSGPVAGGTSDFGGNASNGTDTGTNSRGAYTLPYNAGQIRATWINVGNGSNGEVFSQPGTPVTITASVEYPAGTFTQICWNGAPSATIQSGGFTTCDPVALYIPANTTFWIRTYLTVTAGNKWYTSGWSPGGGTSSGGTTQTDQTMSGTISGSYADPFLPSCVQGISIGPNTLRIAGIGDSITAGFADSGNGLGWFGRAFTGYRYGKFGQSGLKIAGVGGGISLSRTLALASGANAAMVMFGTNDFTFGSSATTIETYLINLMLVLQSMGMTCYSCTIPPLTTSTDSWATTANQTVNAHEAVRVALNDWIRAGLPVNSSTFAPVAIGTGGALLAGQAGHPVLRVYDLCSACETSQDSGIWKVNGTAFAFTGDGTHPSATSYANMAALISVPQILADLNVAS